MTNEVIIRDLSDATSREMAEKVIEILNTRKAHNVKLLRVEDQTVISDYFVICSATSNTQVKSLAAEIEYKMGLCAVDPLHLDGYSEGQWAVIDYGSVMVHVFLEEARQFYKLEKLWADSEEVDISALFAEN
ncbi:MAG: ribosome silencing factor [Clostridia bacterium]|nr:ribosome silencing factor [Clostridia bacterium]